MPPHPQSAPPAPPAAPAAPQAPAIPTVPGLERAPVSSGSPAAVYNALKAQRKELVRQLEQLEEKRSELSERLEEPTVGGADRKGLEQRIAETDQRIAEVDKLIAASERGIAEVAAIPGAVLEPPPPVNTGPGDEVVVVPVVLTMFVLFPLTIAYARRIWRRGAAAVASLPAELTERLTRLEQAVDTIAVETERISEGQRFMNKLFAETGAARALAAGQGAAQPVEIKAQEGAKIPVR